MAIPTPAKTPLPIGSIIALILLISGIFVRQLPLESSRPAAGEIKSAHYGDVQDVDARLWQDPFEAIALYRTKQSGKTPDDNHDLKRLQNRLAAELGNHRSLTVMGVMVFGGPYTEDTEFRRRSRYAVVAALDIAGYTPDDSENLGYLTHIDAPGLPEAVPYEFFINEQSDRRVLVLWIDEDALGDARPLSNLDSLLTLIVGPTLRQTDKDTARVAVKIIGPASSTTLKAMLEESATTLKAQLEGSTATGDSSVNTRAARITGPTPEFYSATTTANLAALEAPTNGGANAPQLWLLNRPAELFRTITTDAGIARALAAELRLRGIDINASGQDAQHVVLISESDTDYGRNLPRQVVLAMSGCGDPATSKGNPVCSSTSANPRARGITQVTYMRGLDGNLPGSAKASSSSAKKDDKDPTKSDLQDLERAEGSSQFDYLRRLATRLRERADRLDDRNRGEITAIGVLGSDFYDKLLVMQALRPQFPKAIFFTTDLDARLLFPADYKWTRNVLVGSSFGFELAPGLQRRIPPFRDSYQVSSFLATRLALDTTLSPQDKHTKLAGWLNAPHVYEIGRTQAFALDPFVNTSAASAATAGSFCANFQNCRDVRPALPALWPDFDWTDWVIVALGVVTVIVLLRSYAWGFRRAMENVTQPWYRMVKVTAADRGCPLPALGALALLVIIAAALVYWAHRSPAVEPFRWAEGISMWPTQIIRVLAFVLSCILIYRTWRPEVRPLHTLELEFFPQLASDSPVATVRSPCQIIQDAWTCVRRLFSNRATQAPREVDGQRSVACDPSIFRWNENYKNHTGPIDATRLWAEYQAREIPSARLRRVAPPLVAYALFCYCLTYAFGGLPNVPYRGAMSLWADIVMSGLAAFAFAVLLFSIIDAIRLCSTFIRNLSLGRSEYSPATVAQFRAETNFDSKYPDYYLCDWIDVRLIAARTQQIEDLVYYPFLILALVLVARNPLFDYWYAPPGLLLVFASGFALAIGCALMLQNVAHGARRVAIDRVTRYLIRAKSERDAQPLVAQLEMILEEIKNERRGAFLPFTQQPLVKAILLPLGSFGGLQLIEYFALVF